MMAGVESPCRVIDEHEDYEYADEDDNYIDDEEDVLKHWWERELGEMFDINPRTGFNEQDNNRQLYTSQLKLQTVDTVIDCCEQLVVYLEEQG